MLVTPVEVIPGFALGNGKFFHGPAQNKGVIGVVQRPRGLKPQMHIKRFFDCPGSGGISGHTQALPVSGKEGYAKLTRNMFKSLMKLIEGHGLYPGLLIDRQCNLFIVLPCPCGIVNGKAGLLHRRHIHAHTPGVGSHA